MTEPAATRAKDNAGVIAPPPLIGLATLAIGLLADWLYPTHVLSGLLAWPIRVLIGGAAFAAGALSALRDNPNIGRVQVADLAVQGGDPVYAGMNNTALAVFAKQFLSGLGMGHFAMLGRC